MWTTENSLPFICRTCNNVDKGLCFGYYIRKSGNRCLAYSGTRYSFDKFGELIDASVNRTGNPGQVDIPAR